MVGAIPAYFVGSHFGSVPQHKRDMVIIDSVKNDNLKLRGELDKLLAQRKVTEEFFNLNGESDFDDDSPTYRVIRNQ